MSSTSSSGRKANIGKTLIFEGNIKGDEDLVIKGTIEGTITLNDASLIVAKKGLVRGDIIAKAILVEGEVRGELRGAEIVEIGPTGIVHGDVRAPRVMLQDGCQFKGQVDMDHKESASSDRSRPTKAAPPSVPKSKLELKAPPKVPSLSLKH